MNLELLKQRKKELRLTNQQLADLSGVSLGTINKIFSGATKSPQMATINALLSVLKLDTYEHSKPLDSWMMHEPSPAYQLEQEQKLYTTEDIEALPEQMRAELIDGQIYYMSSPSRIHQALLAELFMEIKTYIRQNHGQCQIYPAPFAVFLNKDNRNYVEPDISVICDRNKLDDRGCNGAPDWIIEIVSPSSRRIDYFIKLFQYQISGVREYWIIDPEKEKVLVYQFAAEDGEEYTFDDCIPVGIYEDLTIDFKKIYKQIKKT